MLSSRPPLFLASFASALLFAGCLLNGGPLDSGGDGGAAGSSNTGASTATSNGGSTTGTVTGHTGGTGGTGGSNTTTTTSDPPECTSDADCNNGNPCRIHTCPDGTCHHDPVDDGPLPDNDLHDCQRPLCSSGEMITEVDATQDPDQDSTDCLNTYCLEEGGTQSDAVNNGQLCGSQPGNPCKESVCDNKECVVKDKNDGEVVSMGNQQDCRDEVCQGGMPTSVPNKADCGDDPNEDDCKIPACSNQGACQTANAPQGTQCYNGGSPDDYCDGFGNCF
jgi:hypothetical protein